MGKRLQFFFTMFSISDCRYFLILEFLSLFLRGDWLPTSVILNIILVQLKESLNHRIETIPNTSRGLGVVGNFGKAFASF